MVCQDRLETSGNETLRNGSATAARLFQTWEDPAVSHPELVRAAWQPPTPLVDARPSQPACLSVAEFKA